MKRYALFPALAVAVIVLTSGCGGADLVDPVAAVDLDPSLSYTQACWGQATAAFAKMGEMGEHASQQSQPRDGLANLARYLYNDGVLDAPTLQALAAWLVSIDPNLTVEACMD